MSKWGKFNSTAQETQGEALTRHPTMYLRWVQKGAVRELEQLIEWHNSKGMVHNTEWVVIPIILDTENL